MFRPSKQRPIRLSSERIVDPPVYNDLVSEPSGSGRPAPPHAPEIAPVAPAEGAGNSETVWLIERGQPERQAPTVWWVAPEGWYPDLWRVWKHHGERWTTEARLATRMQRHTALMVLDDLFGCLPDGTTKVLWGLPARATEHVFVDRVASSPSSMPDSVTLQERTLLAIAENARSWHGNGEDGPRRALEVIAQWAEEALAGRLHESVARFTDE